MKKLWVLCAVTLVAGAASASILCSGAYSDARSLWMLVMSCRTAASANLPSGNHIGRTGPCFQKCLAYDGRFGASGSLSFPNPFHYGDQPYYCGSADKDPFSKKTIAWNGSKWVNVTR
jgi:hypothetical protein